MDNAAPPATVSPPATQSPIAASPSAASPIELEVRRASALLEGREFASALAVVNALATQVPENRDVLFLMAACLRHLNRIPDALAALERLERHHPGFSRLYQERGFCHVVRKDAPQAIDAFLTGVNINPALPQSWSMLEGLYRMRGETENAGMAAAHVATLTRLPPEIVLATALFSDGDLAPAESIIRAYLLKHGDHIEAMRLLARIGIAREIYDDAELLLDAVLKLAPQYRAARFDYARALLERHKHGRARAELETLLALEPKNRQYLTLYATVCVGLGEHEKSIELYRGLLAEASGAAAPGTAAPGMAAPGMAAPGMAAPGAADLHLSLAHSLKTVGRREESIAAYRAAAAARPSFGDAYWSLANLKTYRFSEAELIRMRAEEGAPTTALVDRYHLCFALGKAYEDRGAYAESFHFYEQGNALKKSASRYRPELIERNTRLQRQVCTREFFAERVGWGAPSPAPIFIVGLPRSGSTLLEQILASHSLVEGTSELADIPRMALDMQGRDPDLEHPPYPGVLAQLRADDVRRLGEKYLTDTAIYRTGKPYFIDKMPNNFRHLGLIHLILPNARIIDARREPMACCFGNFKQLFASGQEFTYSLSDIARYYRTYLELMAHWNEVLPGRVLKVEHEAVVDDLDGNVRRILEFCGLDFEPSCVEFHKTERSIRTASSEQVRQPIFREGLDQWKRYEPWLGPLKAALGDAEARYRAA
jgi:tetratricopeptide (TPR) repeat protein